MKIPFHNQLIAEVRKQLDAVRVSSAASILVGVSGGIDSMVLIDVLHKLDYSVAVAHVNYRLRGEDSAADAQLVEEWCAQKNIPFLKKEIDTKEYAANERLNIQSAARNIRYAWWALLKNEGQFDYVATAHHKDDAIETALMNLVRGTGIKGLKGIDAVRDYFIRPLIAIPKADIIRYATEQNIPFREDASNDTDAYQRNRIRHHLVPLLRELSDEGGLLHSVHRIRIEWTAYKHAYKAWKTDALFETQECTTIKYEPAQLAFVLAWLEEFGVPWMLAKDFIEGQDSGKTLVYKDIRLLKSEKELYVLSMEPFKEIVINGPGIHAIGNDRLVIEFIHALPDNLDEDVNTAYINPGSVRWPLQVRSVLQGDIFQPFGMHGQHKKLQDYLTDQKLNAFEKMKVRLLVNAENILWVIGMRLDERARIVDSSKGGYRLRYIKNVS